MGDGRDWTFVLDKTCGECGQDVRGLDQSEQDGAVGQQRRIEQSVFPDDALERIDPQQERGPER